LGKKKKKRHFKSIITSKSKNEILRNPKGQIACVNFVQPFAVDWERQKNRHPKRGKIQLKK